MGFDSMKIKVTLSRTKQNRNVDLETGSTVNDLLKKLELKPDTLIVMSNNTPIPIDDVLTDNQEILIIQVSSGG
jgi:sulfur carrier protein ThiS